MFILKLWLKFCLLFKFFIAYDTDRFSALVVVNFFHSNTSHMSGALDGTEKIWVQKLDHPMLVQPILSQKMEKSKFFNKPFFRNPPISIFPYVKLEVKWRKKGSLCAVNCLNLFRKGLNSLLNKHWHEPKPLRIQSCSFQWKYVSKIGFILQFFVII